MIRLTIPLLSLLAVAASLPAQGGGGDQAAVTDRPAVPRVGVVDLAKALESYPRAIGEHKKIEALKEERQKELDAGQKRVEDMQLQRDNYRRDSQEYAYKDLEIQLALRALDGRRQIYNSELARKREQFYVTMLEDMQQAVAKVAKERGVALVLRVHEDLIDGSLENKARVFEARVVWFADERIDLTPDVVKLLQVMKPAAAEAATDAAGANGPGANGPGAGESGGGADPKSPSGGRD